MKFKTTAGTFGAAVASVMPAVGRNAPVLENIAIVLSGNTLTVTANNLEIALTATAEVFDGEDGQTTVNAQKLNKILAGLPSEQTVTWQLDKESVVLKSGRSKYKLATLLYEDFPLPDSEDGDSFSIESADLKQLIRNCMHAMGDQDARFYLNGMLFEIMLNGLRVVATDGHRLATQTCRCEGNDIRAIVPNKSVKVLYKLLQDGEITIAISKRQIRASVGGVSFYSKLIDGRFPGYGRVIPEDTPGYTVQASEIADIVKRTQILSNEKYRGVRLTLSKGLLQVSAQNPEQETAEDEMQVDYDGAEFVGGYNAVYLTDVMSLFDGKVSVCHPDGRMKVTSGDFVGIVMEMRL